MSIWGGLMTAVLLGTSCNPKEPRGRLMCLWLSWNRLTVGSFPWPTFRRLTRMALGTFWGSSGVIAERSGEYLS